MKNSKGRKKKKESKEREKKKKKSDVSARDRTGDLARVRRTW